MKQRASVVTAILLAASVAASEDGVRLRYLDASGPAAFAVSQDIEVPRTGEPVRAERRFAFDLALAADAERVTVTVETARASYTAHGQRQRLGTRQVKSRSFPLFIREDGRRLARAETSDVPLIGLGPFPPVGFSVAGAVADCLPVLPEEPVADGTTWTTEQPVRTLEGWSWAKGPLTSRHRVTAVSRREGRTLVSVATEAEADLAPEAPDGPEPGRLSRSGRWTFDATDGRLLSMSIVQESEGASALPQGEVRHRQRTRIELGPRSPLGPGEKRP